MLVKTIQGCHASLTVCIQDKSAFWWSGKPTWDQFSTT